MYFLRVIIEESKQNNGDRKMKEGQKLTHLRNCKKYYISRVLKNNRFLIESNDDCVILDKEGLKLNFK